MKKNEKKLIDLSLESNFGIREHRKSWAGPVHRPREFFAAIIAAITLAYSATAAFIAGGIGFGAWVGAITPVLLGAIVVGLSVWSYVGSASQGGSRQGQVAAPTSMDNNGQLINTRQAAKVMPVPYGEVRVGGNWVFSRSTQNAQILNAVITWGEGEIEGFMNAIDYVPLYSGTTLNDIHTGGDFTVPGCSCNETCYTYTSCTCNATCDGYSAG